MSRTRRFLGGLGIGYFSMVLTLVVGLWLTPFLLGQIGTHEYGLWLITTQILGYLMLLDLGVVALAPRETAYATGRRISGEVNDVPRTFARFRTIVRWQVLPTALVCAGAWWMVTAEWQELQVPLAIILLSFLLAFPLRLYHATLQGLQDLSYLAKVQIGSWIAGTAVTIALVIAGLGLAALAAGWVVTQAASAIACAVRLRSGFDEVWQAPAVTPSIADAKDVFARSGWVSLSQVGQVFLNGSDLLVLGAVLGPAATVPYACTGKLITVLANHPQLLMQTAAPALAEMRTSATHTDIARVAGALMRAMLIGSGAVACFVLAANETFVSWWVGGDQYAGMTLTVLLLAVMLVRHFSTTLVYALFSFGHERRLSLTALSDGIVTLAVTTILLTFSNLGILSAALGSLAGVILVSIPACSRALARELQIGSWALVGSVRGWLLRFVVAAAASLLVSRAVGGHGIAGVAVAGLATAVIYGGLMWPLLVEPPLGPYVRAALGDVGGLFGIRSEPAVERRV